EKSFFLCRVRSLVCERDFQTGIEKCKFAQTRRETLELKLCRDCEDCRIWKKRNEGSSSLFVFDLADNREFVRRFALGESHVIDLAITRHFHLEPFRKRIRALRAYSVQAARIFVGALSKFSASVQIGEHQLDRRHFPFGMNIYGNSTAIVAHRYRSIDVDGHFYLCAKPGEMFIDRVIQYLENQVVQTPFIRIANEHSRPFSNRFQA